MENETNITTLHNLLDTDLRKFTAGELELRNALHQWNSQASAFMLKESIQKYLGFIQTHITNMERFFDQENLNSHNINARIIKAFIEEINEKLSSCTDLAVKDACLLAGIQCINHYKISIYGTAAAFAKSLGLDEAAKTFHQAEVDEKQIDDRLSQLAEFEINAKAVAPIFLQ